MVAILLASAATPALAGETVLYEAAPDWALAMERTPNDVRPGDAIRHFDLQARLDRGMVHLYQDIGFDLASPQALNAMSTLRASWQPDKGDLKVHHVELWRDGEVVDVLADGATFDLLRREQQLERRMLDGMLTAVLTVPGAQVGDTLRFAWSMTVREQAFPDELQFEAPIPVDPMPIARGRIRVSWPQASDIEMNVRGLDERDFEIVRAGGRSLIELDVPQLERDNVPDAAPPRYRLPPALGLSSFADYAEVASSFAPHFATAGTIAPGGPIADELARIASLSDDPLDRAAHATRLVQDEISYLMNGLDGGNYLPQTPEETWRTRLGDCKAKSLLLLAMLRELGIEADAALVHSAFGDALPGLLPKPGNFDHMIVRARIGGTDYWLDGTASGLRRDNIAEVPHFRHALPIREAHATLVPIAMRTQPVPDEIVKLEIDARAGLMLPAPFTASIAVSGPTAAPWQTLAQTGEADEKRKAIENALQIAASGGFIASSTLTYDGERGVAMLSGSGLLPSGWERKGTVFEYRPSARLTEMLALDMDRSKPEWQDIPVFLGGSIYYRENLRLLLPGDGGAIALRGETGIDRTIANTAFSAHAALDGDVWRQTHSVRREAFELPAGQLSEAKRDYLKLSRELPRLRATNDTRLAFEYDGTGADRDRLEQLYATAEAIAEKDEAGSAARLLLVSLYALTGRLDDAVGAMDEIIEDDPGAAMYRTRAHYRYALGRFEGALADFDAADRESPDDAWHYDRIEVLGLLGRPEEALVAADDAALVLGDEKDSEPLRAHALGWAGQREQGYAILADLAQVYSEDSGIANAQCWYAGIWDMVDDAALESCDRAVELASAGYAALDSRALAYHRTGRTSEAIAELDRVLRGDPSLQASRYLRGMLRLGQGDAGGRRDLDTALRAEPSLTVRYAAWGLEPKG